MIEHPKTEDCDIDECSICAERDCPFGEPLHYHHDGCPACYEESGHEWVTLDKDKYNRKEYEFQKGE